MKCFFKKVEVITQVKRIFALLGVSTFLCTINFAHAALPFTSDGKLAPTLDLSDKPDFNFTELFSQDNVDAGMFSSPAGYLAAIDKIESEDVFVDQYTNSDAVSIASQDYFLDVAERNALSVNFATTSASLNSRSFSKAELEKILGRPLTEIEYQTLIKDPNFMAQMRAVLIENIQASGEGKESPQDNDSSRVHTDIVSLEKYIGGLLGGRDFSFSDNSPIHGGEAAQSIFPDLATPATGFLADLSLDDVQSDASTDRLFDLGLKAGERDWETAFSEAQYVNENDIAGAGFDMAANLNTDSSYFGSGESSEAPSVPGQIKIEEPKERALTRAEQDLLDERMRQQAANEAGHKEGDTIASAGGSPDSGYSLDRAPASTGDSSGAGSSDSTHSGSSDPSTSPASSGNNDISPLAKGNSAPTAGISEVTPQAPAAPTTPAPNSFQKELEQFDTNFDSAAKAAGAYPGQGLVSEEAYQQVKADSRVEFVQKLNAAEESKAQQTDDQASNAPHGGSTSGTVGDSGTPVNNTNIALAKQGSSIHQICSDHSNELVIDDYLEKIYNPDECTADGCKRNTTKVSSPLAKAVEKYKLENKASTEAEAKVAVFSALKSSKDFCKAYAKEVDTPEKIAERNQALDKIFKNEKALDSIIAMNSLKEPTQKVAKADAEASSSSGGHPPDETRTITEYVADRPRIANSDDPKDCIQDIVDQLYTLENFNDKIGSLGTYVSEQVGLLNTTKILKPSIETTMAERVKKIKDGIIPSLEEPLKKHKDPHMFCRSKEHVINLLKPNPTKDYLTNLGNEEDFKEALEATAWFQGVALAGLMDSLNLYNREAGTCNEPGSVPAHEGTQEQSFARAVLVANFAHESAVNGIGALHSNQYKDAFKKNTYGMKAMNCLVKLSGVPLEKAKESLNVPNDYRNLTFDHHIKNKIVNESKGETTGHPSRSAASSTLE